MTHPIAPLLKRFFSHWLPVQKGLSVNTVRAYRDAVKLLLCDVADALSKSVDRLAVEDLTEPRVLDFLDRVEAIRGCTRRTRNARLAAIRGLFAFIARERPVLSEQARRVRAIPLKRAPYRSVDYLEEGEMQALLDAVNPNSRTGLRDRALLLLLYNTGARVGEIVALRLCDLRLDRSPQVRLRGKGDKSRSCPLWPETAAALEDHLERSPPPQPPARRLFLNANGAPITRFGIRHLTRKYGALARSKLPSLEAKPVNPHTIRHTTAMHLLRSGNDINMVSYWLGHADLNTTHVYVEIDMETKRKMLAKADAPGIREEAAWRRPRVLEWLRQLARDPKLCAVNHPGDHGGQSEEAPDST